MANLPPLHREVLVNGWRDPHDGLVHLIDTRIRTTYTVCGKNARRIYMYAGTPPVPPNCLECIGANAKLEEWTAKLEAVTQMAIERGIRMKRWP